ncbi:MAG: TIGR02452 family protein [Roseburia sp.]|nr:TIGR02452 family protein [Roseburia sp.]
MAFGNIVNIKSDIEESVENSYFIPVEEPLKWLTELSVTEDGQLPECYRKVWQVTATEALENLCRDGAGDRAVLNFADALEPGGGFQSGAKNQESGLCSTSSLYLTQLKHKKYYDCNKEANTPVYTDAAIFSRNVVFFRDDNGNFLVSPFTASVLTLPAVNRVGCLKSGMDDEEQLKVMKRRMLVALTILSQYSCKNVVLGAYGCGRFGQSADWVASTWVELLSNYFPGTFESVVFAVPDYATYSVFRNHISWEGT